MSIKNFIEFENVTFAYPVEGEEEGKNIFQNFNASLPGGLVCLIGPNGSGKSTFLLLASGRLVPAQGIITLFNEDIVSKTEEKRNLSATVLYQNMEFETTDVTRDVLEEVWKNGANLLKNKDEILKELIAIFELESVLDRPVNKLSKGEMQRTLLVFSILYGARSIFMDEPLFAMEPKQKETALAFLKKYSKDYDVPIYISMHELELSRKYADNVLLFYPNRDIDFGTPAEVLEKDSLEKAYGIPVAMLKDAENLNRKVLMEQIQEIENSKNTIDSN